MVKFDLYPEQEYDLKVVKKLNGQDGVYDKFIKTISTMGFTPSTPINEKFSLPFTTAVLSSTCLMFILNMAAIKLDQPQPQI